MSQNTVGKAARGYAGYHAESHLHWFYRNTSRFWDLLEIGIGGYVIGRSAEKVAGRLKGGRK